MSLIKPYFPAAALFITLCKGDLTFESVDEILKGNHSNKSCPGVISCGTNYLIILYERLEMFDSVDKILKCDHSNGNY